jgi:hypothetical protein
MDFHFVVIWKSLDTNRYTHYVYECIYLLVYIGINIMAMKKVMVSLPDEMVEVLEKERKERLLETIPETIRVILSDYLRNR